MSTPNHKCVGVAQHRHCTLVLPETATGRSPEQPLQLVEFDKQGVLEVLCQGQTVIPFWCDRIHQRLRDNLSSFINH